MPMTRTSNYIIFLNQVNKYAAEIEAQPMKKQVSKHEDVYELDYTIESVPGPSRVLMNITNENYEKLVPVAKMTSTVTPKPGSSQLFNESKREHQKLVSSMSTKKIQKLNDTALYKNCRKHMKRISYLNNRVKQLKFGKCLD